MAIGPLLAPLSLKVAGLGQPLVEESLLECYVTHHDFSCGFLCVDLRHSVPNTIIF